MNITEKAYRVSFDAMRQHIEEEKLGRSAWYRGVKVYALEMLEELEENVMGGYIDVDKLFQRRGLRDALLNGARDWESYSYGGSSLIYDWEIAERLCTPSELRKTRGGERNPNGRETWLDVQRRALYQAYNMIGRALDATAVKLETSTTVDSTEAAATVA